MVEDARLCLFGRNISKSDRCSVVILNSKREEEVIAETDFREYGTVACLNGEFFLLFLYNSRFSMWGMVIKLANNKRPYNARHASNIGYIQYIY